MLRRSSRRVSGKAAGACGEFCVTIFRSFRFFGLRRRACLRQQVGDKSVMSAPADSPTAITTVVVGEGPPLVVFPGLSRTPVTGKAAYVGLARVSRRQVHVVNRPSGLPRGLTMAGLAGRHARFLAARFSAPIDLIGISTGGAVALQLAVDHPNLVNRLIVAAAASWLGAEGREKLRLYGDAVEHGLSGARILASVLAVPRWEWLLTPLLWFAHQLERRTSAADLLATIDAEVGFDVTARLGQVRARTLLIAGGRDRAFPLPLVEATAAGITVCKLIVYPTAGHIGTMVNRRFGPDVATFLSAEVGESASSAGRKHLL